MKNLFFSPALVLPDQHIDVELKSYPVFTFAGNLKLIGHG